jgi:hypothetical protein
MREEMGDNADDLASALTAALLAKRPLDVFKIDENLSLAAFSGLPLELLKGDFGGVVDSSDPVEGFGLETEIVLFSGDSPAFFGDLRTEVETDLIWPRVLVLLSGIVGCSRRGDFCLGSSPRLGILNCAPPMVSFPRISSRTSVE